MLCPQCGQRKGRRHCPALGQTICSICCGTKRLVEINCPADCVHLTTSRDHPAATVRRQQEHDLAALMPTIRHLTERQHQLFYLFHSLIARHVPDGFARIIDDDVAEAARSMAATLETASRGVIYDHVPASLSAQRLTAEMRTLLAQLREQGATVHDAEAATALRALEQGAHDVRRQMEDGGDTAYLDLMARLLRVNRAARDASPAGSKPASSIILP